MEKHLHSCKDIWKHHIQQLRESSSVWYLCQWKN